MAKYCSCCGSKDNSFNGDPNPLQLENGKILCYKCTKPISYEWNQLYYVQTTEEFDFFAESIINKSKELFEDDIVQQICIAIDIRRQKAGYLKEGGKVSKEQQKIVEESHKNISRKSSHSHSDGIFSNIGGKIKGFAELLTWLGILGSIFSGLWIMSIDDDFIIPGILVIVIGSLVSWISHLLLYGFGQLIQNSDILVENSDILIDLQKKK